MDLFGEPRRARRRVGRRRREGEKTDEYAIVVHLRHKVAPSNKHVFGRHVGDSVLQPSRSDGGSLPADLVATVLRVGSLDAAVATPVDPSVVTLTVAGGGAAVFAIAGASIDMRVQKTGRGSGLTHGVVELIDLEVDAGAIGPARAVGLHWGGSGRDGVGHHIGDVFEDLGVAVDPASIPSTSSAAAAHERRVHACRRRPAFD